MTATGYFENICIYVKTDELPIQWVPLPSYLDNFRLFI